MSYLPLNNPVLDSRVYQVLQREGPSEEHFRFLLEIGPVTEEQIRSDVQSLGGSVPTFMGIMGKAAIVLPLDQVEKFSTHTYVKRVYFPAAMLED